MDFSRKISAFTFRPSLQLYAQAADDMKEGIQQESSDIISELPLSSVKFHQLQIIEDTVMAEEYKKEPSDFNFFTWEEYQDFFISFLERLNPSIVVERFTGEAPPKLILSPRWGKGRSDGLMVEFERKMEELDTWQGRLYGGSGKV